MCAYENKIWDVIGRYLEYFLMFWKDVFSDLISISVTFTVPIITGAVIGHLGHLKWADYPKYLCVCYSILYGYVTMLLLSVPVTLFTFLNPHFRGDELVLLYIPLLVIGLIGGIVNAKRERKEKAKEERTIKKLQEFLGLT